MDRTTIEQLIDDAAEEIRTQCYELIDSIQEAEKAALEASQETESGKAKIGIGAKISIDLAGNTFKVTTSVPVTHKIEGELQQIGGPKQTNFLDDLKTGKVEIHLHKGTDDNA